MKSTSIFSIGVSLLFLSLTGFTNGISDNQTQASANSGLENALNIRCNSNLSGLASSWITEYVRLNPAARINLNKVADMQSVNGNSLLFTADESLAEGKDGSAWKMVIGHDIIVPIVNSRNPMLEEICRQGISAGKFTELLTDPKARDWSGILIGGKKTTIHMYILNDEDVKANIARFAKIDPAAIKGIEPVPATALVKALQTDLYAIGFIRLKDIYTLNLNELTESISLLPIDKNGNGRIDPFENIYSNPAVFARGVWVGKYPKSLSASIYATAPLKPTNTNALAFLSWVLKDGGQFLNPNGYGELSGSEIQSNLAGLTNTGISIVETDARQAAGVWIISILCLVLTGLAIALLVRKLAGKKSMNPAGDIHISQFMNEHTVSAPKGLYFDKTHTWAFMEKDGIVKVGIDDFLQHITGTITRVKMKEPGEKVRKGEKILTLIRYGKHLSIYSPVSGIIREQNKALESNSSILNSSPYTEGWVYMIEPQNWLRETQFMFMCDKYIEWLKDEFARLKDFIAMTISSNASIHLNPVLQDGGELSDKILADLGPEVWEDFQTNFIDSSR